MSSFSVDRFQVIVLTVADLEQSRRFYTDLLGLSFAGELSNRFLEYTVGDIPLMLHLDTGSVNAGKENPAPGVALYLGVDNVDAAIEYLRASGVTILEEPATQSWGKRDACIADPDGYRIHLSSEQFQEKSGMAAEFKPAE